MTVENKHPLKINVRRELGNYPKEISIAVLMDVLYECIESTINSSPKMKDTIIDISRKSFANIIDDLIYDTLKDES